MDNNRNDDKKSRQNQLIYGNSQAYDVDVANFWVGLSGIISFIIGLGFVAAKFIHKATQLLSFLGPSVTEPIFDGIAEFLFLVGYIFCIIDNEIRIKSGRQNTDKPPIYKTISAYTIKTLTVSAVLGLCATIIILGALVGSAILMINPVTSPWIISAMIIGAAFSTASKIAIFVGSLEEYRRFTDPRHISTITLRYKQKSQFYHMFYTGCGIASSVFSILFIVATLLSLPYFIVAGLTVLSITAGLGIAGGLAIYLRNELEFKEFSQMDKVVDKLKRTPNRQATAPPRRTPAVRPRDPKILLYELWKDKSRLSFYKYRSAETLELDRQFKSYSEGKTTLNGFKIALSTWLVKRGGGTSTNEIYEGKIKISSINNCIRLIATAELSRDPNSEYHINSHTQQMVENIARAVGDVAFIDSYSLKNTYLRQYADMTDGTWTPQERRIRKNLVDKLIAWLDNLVLNEAQPKSQRTALVKYILSQLKDPESNDRQGDQKQGGLGNNKLGIFSGNKQTTKKRKDWQPKGRTPGLELLPPSSFKTPTTNHSHTSLSPQNLFKHTPT